MEKEQLLNHLQQNIQMVLETIPEVSKAASDCDLKSELNEQESVYRELFYDIRKIMDECDYEIKEINEVLKLYSEWMTKLKALTDDSSSHLAELCIEGYTMGMVKAIQDQRQCPDAPAEHLALAGKLADQHQKSIDALKKYL